MPHRSWNPDGSLPPRLALAFAPLHKAALGTAVGLTLGTLVAAVTAFHVIARPENAPDIALLTHYFYGYTVSWTGTLVGLFWGCVTGFVMGWFVAFVRNFSMAAWLFVVKTKANLSQPFLDHI